MGFQSMADIAFGQQVSRRPSGLFVRIILAAVLLWQPLAFCPSEAHAAEVSLKEFPFVVRCEVKGFNHFFYLSMIGPDGVALYLTPGKQGGTITIDGTAKRITEGAAGSCAGKTLEQLRTAGQSYDFQR